MADLFERGAAATDDRPAPRAAGTPTHDEFRAVPWGGDGPDPLEELYEAS